MLTWEPTPKLNSYIIPCHLIQVTKFTQTAKPDFETRFYWLWFYGLFHSRSAFEFHHVFINALCSLSFNGASKNFEFRWSITGFILKALPVLPAFLLSAKCRFWRITPKRFQVTVNTIITHQIIYSQFSAILGNLLIVITKFIPGNTCSFSYLLWSFFHSDEHKGLVVQLSILVALRGWSPKKIFHWGNRFI